MERDETRKERLDRELEELLQELRVALPGVQILFAFLLVVPFNNRFREVTELQRDVYVVAILCALAAVACFISPTAYHRIRFREFDKERLIVTSTWLTRVGLVFLAASLTASILLVMDFVFDLGFALLVAFVSAAVLVGLWFVLPLVRKVTD